MQRRVEMLVQMEITVDRHSFILAFWGDHTKSTSRSIKVRKDLVKAADRERRGHPIDPLVFVWGERNLAFVESLGVFRAKLVDPRPIVYRPVYRGDPSWRHKLEAWRLALAEYDQMVSIDADIRLLRPLPEDFWAWMAKRDRLQANLLCYKNYKARWRHTQPRRSPSAAFVYCHDPRVPEELLALYDAQPWGFRGTEETAMAWWFDREMGGWKGPAAYGRRFDPQCCVLPGRWDGLSLEKPEEVAIRNSRRELFSYR